MGSLDDFTVSVIDVTYVALRICCGRVSKEWSYDRTIAYRPSHSSLQVAGWFQKRMD